MKVALDVPRYSMPGCVREGTLLLVAHIGMLAAPGLSEVTAPRARYLCGI